MGRSCTYESLGGKQGKPGGFVVQTPGAKCGDRGQVMRAPRIGVTKGFGHVYLGKLNRPPLLSDDMGRRMRDIRVEQRWTGARCKISEWNGGGQAPDVRYPSGTSADRIPDMRYSGGIRENFRPGEMRDATCRKEPNPQWVVVQAVEGSSGQLHDHLVGSKI
uniref:Uncharacterized protein n=1 Tax=Vitis vinifera TaxID=29760 RepID=A5C4Y4_VITVI|nr:hypothetical protein VITISV_019623 [Vitis vinifera]